MKKQKILAVFLCVSLLISILTPFSVFAQTDLGVTSGSCGENLTWSYDTLSGALTIEGSGEMTNFAAKQSPWHHLMKNIYYVYIGEGVTSIGDWAFAYCYLIKQVNFPETSLTRIGYNAFYQGLGLEEVYIPESVNTLGNAVFAYCKNLIAVSIPTSVTEIKKLTFYGCESLSRIYYAGTQSQWNAIVKDASDAPYYEKAEIICDTKTGIEWSVEDGTLVISGVGRMDNYGARQTPWYPYADSITKIVVKEGISGLGNRAFAYLENAKEIILPETVVYIGSSAFYKCAALENITLPSDLKTLSNSAFYNCTSLKSVNIPLGVTIIYNHTFLGCSALETAYYNGTEYQWSKVDIRDNNEALLNALVVYTVPTVSYTFDEETGTLTVFGTAAMDNWASGEAPWYSFASDIKHLVIEDGIVNIGDYAFYKCTNLETVTIADSVKTLGTGAFYGCQSLKEADLPAEVTDIGTGAFYNNKALTRITFPETLEMIRSYTFDGCTALETVYFGGTREQYDALSIAANNEPFVNADVILAGQFPPAAEVEQLGAINVPYGGKTYTLDTAYSFNAMQTFEDANANSDYKYFHADFVVSFDKDINDVVLAGYYKLYADYVKSEDWVPLTFENVKAGEEIRVLNDKWYHGDGSISYQELCQIQNFLCGVIDEDGDDEGATISVELRLYEMTENSPSPEDETGTYLTVGKYNYTFPERKVPAAEVTELGSQTVTYAGKEYTLDTSYSFKASETFEEANASSKHKYSHADFVVSFDKDVNDVVLAGYYKLYADYVKSEDWVPLVFENVKAGEKIRVLNEKWFAEDGSINYQELCQIGEFLCGVLDENGDDEGTTITVELCLYPVNENSPDVSAETGECIVVGTYTYTFPEKVKIYSYDEQTNLLTLFGNGEDTVAGKEPFAKYSADIKTVNITKDVTVIGANMFANAANIENVIYDGTRAEWKLISIGSGNENLLNANITFAKYQGEMFDKKFDGDFLYRVGNNGAVKLGTLFEAKEGFEIDSATVELKFRSLDETANASVTYVQNTSDWKEGTLTFSGEGVIELAISDLSNETILNLEVVTAKNVTSYSQLVSSSNNVLLNDVKMSANASFHLNNATLYGNGFTFDVTDGAYKGAGYTTGNYLILLQDGSKLDNVKVVGKVYTQYGATSSSDYNRATVISTGKNVVIANSYISNCGSPIRVAEGNIEVINTTLKGGSFANLDVRGGQVTLTDVTTINQVSDNDKGSNGETVVGFGVVSYYETVVAGTTITINGSLTQYNNFAKSHIEYIGNSTAQAFLNTIFGSEYANYIYTDANGEKWVNTGVISMMETVGKDQIIDNRTSHDYIGQKAVSYGKTGYIHAPKAKAPVTANYTYEGSEYLRINKKADFDFTTKNYVPKTEGLNKYCYYDEGQVNISIDSGDTFSWDPFILKDTFKKGGENIPYTVKMNGTEVTGNIPFTVDGEYVVEYTFTDNYNYKLTDSGNVEKYSNTYTATVKIVVAVVLPNAKNATFDFAGKGFKEVKIGNDIYVMPNVTATSSTIGSKSVSGTTVYCPIVNIVMSDNKTSHSSGWYAYFPVFSGVVTITDYADKGLGNAIVYNASTTTLPSNLAPVNPASSFKYGSASTASTTPAVKNNILVYSSPKIEANRDAGTYYVEYIYTDNTGAIYHYFVAYYAPAQSYSNICVAPDTLVTLADGTTKEVQHLTGTETLLVWNHETGKMDTAPIAYIVDHNGEVKELEVITLYFEDGKEIEIIGEHVFYNMDTDKYVTLDKNAKDYIGTNFAMQGADGIYGSKLVNITSEIRNTAAYEVVTYKNVTCFTNGILSASAYLDKLLNIFDIDENSKTYVSAAEDVEKYGLYTYSDFEGLISEEAFELYNAKYLKIAVGKGYITWDDILNLIDIYFTAQVNPIN